MNAKSTDSSQSNVSFTMEDFAQALEEHDYNFQKGQIVKGKVFEHTSEGAYIDIGGKSPGFVPLYEAALFATGGLGELLPLGTELEFLIISNQNADGQVTLSRRQIELQAAWARITELAESGNSVQIKITGVNRGGVTGELEGLRCFIPRSHLVNSRNPDVLVGETVTATFLEVTPEKNKLVLSQRQAAHAAAISKIEEGILMTGTVSNIKPYGIFVDLNGVTGLLHITEISGTRIHSLEELFTVGQELKVMIISIDEVKNRIALSTKILESFPGEVVENFAEVMTNAEERATQAREKLAQESE